MLADLLNELLSALVVYGLPLLFVVVLIASAGVPLPATLVVMAAGAFAQDETLSLPWVLGLTLLAAVIGDHLGYVIGAWGGRPLIRRIGQLFGSEVVLERASAAMQRWGWVAVFFSRWLLTPLGTACNWTCGMTGYSLRSFFLADVLGEAVYIALLVTLGFIFSDQLEYIGDLLGVVGPWLMGVFIIVAVGWYLLSRRRGGSATPQLEGGRSNRVS
jgi:membrane-associated protein